MRWDHVFNSIICLYKYPFLEKMSPHDLSTPPSPALDPEEVRSRKMNRRAKVIQELVQTERDYLKDLELCIQEVIQPLRNLQVYTLLHFLIALRNCAWLRMWTPMRVVGRGSPVPLVMSHRVASNHFNKKITTKNRNQCKLFLISGEHTDKIETGVTDRWRCNSQRWTQLSECCN